MEAPTVKTPTAEALANPPTVSQVLAAIAAAAPRPETERVGYTEEELARALGVSVGWLKKDRITKRVIPFWKIGRAVRYDLARVREALAPLQVGGQPAQVRKRASSSEKAAA